MSNEDSLNGNKTNKNTSKKVSNTIGILIVFLFVTIISGFFIFGILINDKSEDYFEKEDQANSQKIYKSIMAVDEDNYPKTPEEVVKLYTDGYKLIYGGKIKDMSILPYIIEKQRIFFSEQLLRDNPFEQQQINILESIDFLSENTMKIINITINPTIYDDKDKNKAYVRVLKEDNTFVPYYYVYYLEKGVDKKWRITGWYNADENFNII